MDMLAHERSLWERGVVRVAGVDEAGRGPLAGPVIAAAIVLKPEFAREAIEGCLAGLTDSKQLTPTARDGFHAVLTESALVSIGIGQANAAEIDQVNILAATHLAMARAVGSLPSPPEHVLVDGRPPEGLEQPFTAIIGGDGRSLSIAAASVIAKVTRDRMMCALDRLYPQYGFATHKGYGTNAHMQALFEHGPCPIHRRSFRPVREADDMAHRARSEEAGRRMP
jgi:ribonuclease HII